MPLNRNPFQQQLPGISLIWVMRVENRSAYVEGQGLHERERVLPLKEGKKEGNKVMSIQLAERLFGRNVVIRSLNVVINVVISEPLNLPS